jgi:hypothetical protein
MTVRCPRTAAVFFICIAALATSSCTGGFESVSADVPVVTGTVGDTAAPLAAISSPATTPGAAATSVPAAVASPVPAPTTAPATIDPLTAGRSAEGAVPLAATLTFFDRNAIGDKGSVTVLGVKDWDGAAPGDDSGVAVEVELTLAPDAFIPPDSIVTTEPWTAVDKDGRIYRASFVGNGDPTPVYPHRMFIRAGETARGWILIGTLAGVDDGSRPSKTALTIRYELSDDKFLFWKS